MIHGWANTQPYLQLNNMPSKKLRDEEQFCTLLKVANHVQRAQERMEREQVCLCVERLCYVNHNMLRCPPPAVVPCAQVPHPHEHQEHVVHQQGI